MDELMVQFLVEARELVQRSSDDLLALERQPGDHKRLESVFRAVHTLKSSVGLFDLMPMQTVLHAAEDLLSAARRGAVEIDAGLIDPLMAIIEWVELCIADIDHAAALSPEIARQAPALLAAIGNDVEGEAALPRGMAGQTPDWASALLRRSGQTVAGHAGVVALRYEPHPECFFNGDDPLATVARLPSLLHLEIGRRDPWPARQDYEPFRCNLTIEALVGLPPEQVQAFFRMIPDQVRVIDLSLLAAEPAVAGMAQEAGHRAGGSMRVETVRIDALLEIAGELIVAKNGLLPLAAEAQRLLGNDGLARRITDSQQEIARLVGALHGAVTRARMVPLSQTFRRFPRFVRETAARLGKAVDFAVEGGEVEADREIVEGLFEPLLHLVRNALDHGIEAEAERLAAGKPARGVLLLKARQQGQQIDIDLVDDGRGMDPARLRSSAIAKGLLSEEAAAALSDDQALQLPFLAGFSTAATVTDLSGRGVGLDAVKTVLQGLGGQVEIASQAGIGTTIRLSGPISFAMSRLMVVEAGGERYGIAIEAIAETVRVASRQVVAIRTGEAFVLRDRTLPLLRLSDLLHLPRLAQDGRDLTVIVVTIGEDRVGVAVDGIAERAETLMRPLSGLLHGLPGVAGTTMMGDGRVLVVLDLEELVG